MNQLRRHSNNPCGFHLANKTKPNEGYRAQADESRGGFLRVSGSRREEDWVGAGGERRDPGVHANVSTKSRRPRKKRESSSPLHSEGPDAPPLRPSEDPLFDQSRYFLRAKIRLSHLGLEHKAPCLSAVRRATKLPVMIPRPPYFQSVPQACLAIPPGEPLSLTVRR